MTNLIRIVLLFIISSSVSYNVCAQSLGVNATGAPAANSAILDVSSTSKGVLVPRMSKVQKDAITAPATGLLVFQDTPDSIGFHYYTGTKWSWIDTANGKTGWLTNGNAGTNINDHFFGTTDLAPLSFRQNNRWVGRWNNTVHNYFIGDSSGAKTTGANNIGIGSKSLLNNNAGFANVAIGNFVLQNNTTSIRNTGLGDSALFAQSYNPGGVYQGDNTAIGSKALIDNQPTTINNGVKNTAVGSEAMYFNTTGYENTALGVSALRENTIGYGNTALGRSANRLAKSGIFNSYVGYASGYGDSLSIGNTALGAYSFYNHQAAGNFNVAVGYETMQFDSAGSANTAMGWRSLRNNKTGIENTALGVGTLEDNKRGNYNVAVGRSAGFKADTASFTTAIGYSANTFNLQSYVTAVGAYAGVFNAFGATTARQGAENTMIGYGVMAGNARGSQNTAVGHKAMAIFEPYEGLTGSLPSRNVAVGDSTLYKNFGNDNVGVGFRALSKNFGSQHVAVGSRALLNATATYPNTAVGYSSQDSLQTGVANTSLGSFTLTKNKLGSNNTAIGNFAMFDAVNPQGFNYPFDNTAVGNDALRSTRYYGHVAVGAGVLRYDTSGVYNTAVGYLSMAENLSGSVNVALGTSALRNNKTGIGNTALGTNSLINHVINAYNTAIGYESMTADSSGESNTALGWRTLRSNKQGRENTALGVGALEFTDSSFANTAVGRGAMIGQGSNTSDLAYNTSVGYYAGALMDSVAFATAIGTYAGYHNRGKENTFVGNFAGYGASPLPLSGFENTGLGSYSLYANTTGRTNTGVGLGAAFANTTGSNNTALGVRALLLNQTGNNNVAIGDSAMAFGNASNNTAVGHFAMRFNNTGSNNTSVGNFSMSSNTGGNRNVAVGDSALYLNTGGSNNTGIGYRAITNSLLTNSTAIGANAFSGQSNSMVLGSIAGVNNATADTKVGIGTTSPDSLFSVGDNFLVGKSGTAQFDNSVPVMNYMFKSGSFNADRMIIAHSAAFPTFGLQYTDITDKFNFLSNGNPVLTADLNFSRVGVGITTPATRFHIYESTNTNVNARISSFSTAFEPGLELIKTGPGTDWKMRTATTGALIFARSSDDFASAPIDEYEMSSTSFRPFTDGANSLGLLNNRWTTIFATNGVINTSDGREKENIESLGYGLKEIMQLRPVSFNWKANPQWGRKIGFIAQEVKPILNEVVQTGELKSNEDLKDDTGMAPKETDKLGIYYADIIPVTVKAIQEQQLLIEKQAKENDELRKKNEQLEKDIQLIKAKLGIQ